MKKLGLLSIVAAAALALSSCGQNSNIGVVDIQQLLQSPSISALSQSLTTQDAGQQKQLSAAYQTLQAAQTALKNNKDATKNASLQATVNTSKASFDKLMQTAQAAQQGQQQQLQNAIQNAIASVAQSKGISSVYIKQVVLYGKSTDITSDVIAALSAQSASGAATPAKS
jgi:Skp family chaperone for outer membrane proteins